MPRYDVNIGWFLGLYETIRYLVLRGDYDKHFLNYGYCEENSKILYFSYKCKVSNSFAGTLFNRHHLLFETGRLQTEFSNLYYFLPYIADRSESINQHMLRISYKSA